MAQPHIPSSRVNCSGESWLIQVKNTLEASHKMWQVSKDVCIYRVPKPIMNSKQEAYVPLIVSFGPYHHNSNAEFSRIDQHKLEAVRRMITRLGIDVTKLIAEIQKLEPEIRDCYEEPIGLDGQTLSWVLAMDACFILEFLSNSNTDCFSHIFQRVSYNSMICAILDDIIKLENQIPLFILTTILQLEFGTREDATRKLAALLSNYNVFRGFPFSFSWDDDESKLNEYMMKEGSPCHHLLDLYRMVIKDLLTNSSAELAIDVERDGCGGADNIDNGHERSGRSMNAALPGWMKRTSYINILPCLSRTRSPHDSRATPSAKLLQKAGIKFLPGRLAFEKKRFGRSRFFLPQITIWDSTETWLRNLMAYEECQMNSSSPEETVISHFVRLLQDLINSAKDVSVLRESQVIVSWVGSDEDIARIFNRLGDGITFGSVQNFDEVIKEAREYYNSRWRVWWSQLKNEIFSQPWYILTLVSAILMLVMTAVQTVMTSIQTVDTVNSI